MLVAEVAHLALVRDVNVREIPGFYLRGRKPYEALFKVENAGR